MEKEKRKLVVCVPWMNESQVDQVTRACEENGFEPVFFQKIPTGQDILDAEAVFGVLPAGLLNDAPALRWVHCAMAGVNIYTDCGAFTSGRAILSNSNAFGVTIAEHIIMVLLMMMRHMDFYQKLVSERKWGRTAPIDSITGSRIAVIGTGDIGESFGTRARALGAHVVGVRTRNEKPHWCDELYLTADLKKAVSDCDAVVASLPLTPQTEGIFDAEFFGAMKEGSYFVNVGRGPSVVEDALIEALESGHLAGAALDVFVKEPLDPESPLWDTKGLLITPHCAGDTALPYTRQRIVDIFVENLAQYARGETPSAAVDIKKGY
ncbi:MAG: D-2-hydroxyacid dehydrogenase [Eubacteriaceae bacterium]|nr:D-2-hydroxyacid dehydrogenase [Eubacteriaceae bacterium]